MRRILLFPLLAFTATCSDATGPGGGFGPPPQVGIKAVGVFPHNDSLLVGDTLRLQIFVTDSSAHTVTNPKVTWKTTDTAALTVDSTGLITARLAGTAAVIATVGGVSGGAFVTAQWPVQTVLMPDSITITRYEVVQFLPGLEGPTGTEVSDRSVTWTSSDTLIARITRDGVVTPRALGTVFVTASSNGHTDTTRVTIVHEPVRHLSFSYLTPPVNTLAGQSFAVDATCSDTLFREVTDVPITWETSDTSLMTVTVAGNDREPTVHTRRAGSLELRIACADLRDSIGISIKYPTTAMRFVPETVTTAVGQTVQVNAAYVDTLGGRNGFATVVQLQPLDTSIVKIVNGFPIGLKVGQVRLVGTGLEDNFVDTATIRVIPSENLRVIIPKPTVDLPNYSILPTRIYLRDTTGAPPASAHTVTLTSNDTGVVRVSPPSVSFQDTATVTISFGHSGFALVTARVDSLTSTQAVTSGDIPPAQVSMANRPPRVIQVGDTFGLAANVFGTDHGARFYPVTWTVFPPSRARVDTEGISLLQTAMLGRLTALVPGQVTVRASSGGFSDSVVLTIRSLAAPTLATVSPSPMTPGATVTVTGSGFDPVAGNDSVWIEGVPTPVTAATGTSLTFVLPARASFQCTPTHQALVSIASDGALAVDSALLQVGQPESLGADGLARVGPGASSCIELQTLAGQAYWITVANPGTASGSSASFQVAGTSSYRFSPSPVAAPRPATSGPASGAIPIRFDSLVTAALAHRSRLEANAAVMRRLGSPARQWALGRPAPVGPAMTLGARIGDTVRIHVPNISRPDFCSSYASIDARQVYSGTHAQIFEDVTSPVAGLMDSVYASVGAEFDNVDYAELLNDFGDPLILDSLLSRVGKITMVFSPAVNQFGVLGFVTACDFYPESVAPSSNATEIFYGPAPTAPGSGFGAFTADAWRWEIRSTLIHEAKHIASFAARLAHNAPPEETWLEESSAVVAEELWSRAIYQTSWKGDATYSQTLFCDVRPTFPQCAGRPYSMFNAFAFLQSYAGASEVHSPLGPTGFSDASFYGSGWSLLRWAIDQYATSEPQFLRALTQEPALTGVANLEARTGHSFAQMSADWQLMLRTDGLTGFTPTDPEITLPSWNLRDIYQGMSGDFPDSFSPFPEVTRTETTPQFLETVNGLPGGTSVVLFPAWIGDGSLVLGLRGSGGTSPPPLQVEILRYQ